MWHLANRLLPGSRYSRFAWRDVRNSDSESGVDSDAHTDDYDAIPHSDGTGDNSHGDGISSAFEGLRLNSRPASVTSSPASVTSDADGDDSEPDVAAADSSLAQSGFYHSNGGPIANPRQDRTDIGTVGFLTANFGAETENASEKREYTRANLKSSPTTVQALQEVDPGVYECFIGRRPRSSRGGGTGVCCSSRNAIHIRSRRGNDHGVNDGARSQESGRSTRV